MTSELEELSDFEDAAKNEIELKDEHLQSIKNYKVKEAILSSSNKDSDSL